MFNGDVRRGRRLATRFVELVMVVVIVQFSRSCAITVPLRAIAAWQRDLERRRLERCAVDSP
jgi:hypothetical protein